MKETNWNSIRDKFFKECTTTLGNEENQRLKVDMAPHDVFEFFKVVIKGLLKKQREICANMAEVNRESVYLKMAVKCALEPEELEAVNVLPDNQIELWEKLHELWSKEDTGNNSWEKFRDDFLRKTFTIKLNVEEEVKQFKKYNYE